MRPVPLNLGRFHQPCLSPWRSPFFEMTTTVQVGEDCHPRTTWWPLNHSTSSPTLPPCVSLEVFITPTGRFHGRRHFALPSVLRRHSSAKGVCTHASSGPSRVRHRLLCACLEYLISLAKYTVPSSVESAVPQRVVITVDSFDLLIVPVSPEESSFLLIMRRYAPLSTTDSRSSCSQSDRGATTFC